MVGEVSERAGEACPGVWRCWRRRGVWRVPRDVVRGQLRRLEQVQTSGGGGGRGVVGGDGLLVEGTSKAELAAARLKADPCASGRPPCCASHARQPPAHHYAPLLLLASCNSLPPIAILMPESLHQHRYQHPDTCWIHANNAPHAYRHPRRHPRPPTSAT